MDITRVAGIEKNLCITFKVMIMTYIHNSQFFEYRKNHWRYFLSIAIDRYFFTKVKYCYRRYFKWVSTPTLRYNEFSSSDIILESWHLTLFIILGKLYKRHVWFSFIINQHQSKCPQIILMRIRHHTYPSIENQPSQININNRNKISPGICFIRNC